MRLLAEIACFAVGVALMVFALDRAVNWLVLG